MRRNTALEKRIRLALSKALPHGPKGYVSLPFEEIAKLAARVAVDVVGKSVNAKSSEHEGS